jgi:hypothetical protein
MENDILLKVEAFKHMLISRATGKEVDDREYKQLRSVLMTSSRTKSRLPRFVHTCRNPSEFWSFIKPKFSGYEERRIYIRQELDALLMALESENASPSDATVSSTVQSINSIFVTEAWHKALDRRTSDPEGAITASRALLESVCKSILDKASIEYADTAELPKLYTLTSQHLKLAPSQHTEQLFKQILGSCQSVVEGLGAMRNRLSDAHGRPTQAVKPEQRHAELAVNLAGTMATFLIQTWEARKHNV